VDQPSGELQKFFLSLARTRVNGATDFPFFLCFLFFIYFFSLRGGVGECFLFFLCFFSLSFFPFLRNYSEIFRSNGNNFGRNSNNFGSNGDKWELIAINSEEMAITSEVILRYNYFRRNGD
jgi:hypothetical protein